MLVHDRGYIIAPAAHGTYGFYRPDGTPLPASPVPPPRHGDIDGCHDANITPDTIIPNWSGDRLNLHHAIHACFANAAYQARQRQNAGQPRQQAPQADHAGTQALMSSMLISSVSALLCDRAME